MKKMFEGLAKEDNPFDDNIPLPDSFVERMVHKISDSELFNAEPLDIPTMATDFVKEHGFPCPDGYEFRDENGNVINATKIVLEKKEKDVSLTQEQINTMVHDSCVLFCKHFGCGIPRETCISLGTCKDHDEYRAAIRTHLMEKKKKEYPKTYEECCKVMNYCCNPVATKTTHKEELIRKFQFLLLYRDAYWKIAGEEMGLGKPWEPDWTNNDETKFCIGVSENEIIKLYIGIAQYILAFPTEEIRDAFKENFDLDIEFCKELL